MGEQGGGGDLQALGQPAHAVFGAYGAITFMALSGVLLDRLRATTPAPQPDPSTGDRPVATQHT
jgi:hypothetical protein